MKHLSHPEVEINPKIKGGEPVVKGTRILVESVAQMVGHMGADSVAFEYRHLLGKDLEGITAWWKQFRENYCHCCYAVKWTCNCNTMPYLGRIVNDQLRRYGFVRTCLNCAKEIYSEYYREFGKLPSPWENSKQSLRRRKEELQRSNPKDLSPD